MQQITQYLDRKSNLFYLWTATSIATLLAVEELLSAEFDSYNDVLLEFATDVPLFYVAALMINIIACRIVLFANEQFSWKRDAVKRITIELVCIILMTAAISVLIILFFRMFSFQPIAQTRLKFEVLTVIMFFIGISMAFIYQEYLIFEVNQKKISDRSKELEKQHLVAQYETLRNQVNPHFLFNSLNVLSSLLYLDISLAEKFIKKFSEVYRYVLELNQRELVSLKRELAFIDSYLFLQKIRFGENLIICQHIKASALNLQLPPMALQLLIENAIKHNRISEEEPLKIQILSCGSSISVQNNFVQRENGEKSTGLGQRNLLFRYQLIGDSLPEFYIEDQHYIAKIPLIGDQE